MAGVRRKSLLLLSSLALALAPKCPACLLAYLGLAGSATAASSLSAVFRHGLVPLTVACLSLTVGAIAIRAPGRRDVGPVILAVGAAAEVFVGKFLWEQQFLALAGMATLAAAAVWSSLPPRAVPPPDCSCAPGENLG